VFTHVHENYFMLELPTCNANLFQEFLDEFSKQYPEELKIMVLDNGAFHKTRKLDIPNNIILFFLPPYSPELNPTEKEWAKLKRDFTNRLFETPDELEHYLCQISASLCQKDIISLSAYSSVHSDSFWTTV
jgi:transposase